MRNRWIVIGLVAVFSGCTSNPKPPNDTTVIETAPPRTAPPETAPATTVAVAATTATVSTIKPTSLAAPASTSSTPSRPETTIYSTPNLTTQTELDAIPKPSGEYTDTDFARLVGGAFREFTAQEVKRKPDRQRLSAWYTKATTEKRYQRIRAKFDQGIEYRTGSVDEFVVSSVQRLRSGTVIVESCTRDNSAEWQINSPSDTNDDVLVQDQLAVEFTQSVLVKSSNGWKLDAVIAFKADPCDAFFR
jgi:hypothetical protein